MGNGKNIDVWKDKWLPTPFSFKVTTRNLFLAYSLKVRDLIDRSIGGWNVELIKSFI